MAGRPPKPLAIHQIDGTFRADRHAKPSVAKSTGGASLRMPPELDGVAAEHWELVVRERGDWLALSDGPALLSLCQLWDLRCRTLEVLESDPIDKNTRVSFMDYDLAWSKLAGRFGMTPIDRAKIGEQSADEIDSTIDFVSTA